MTSERHSTALATGFLIGGGRSNDGVMQSLIDLRVARRETTMHDAQQISRVHQRTACGVAVDDLSLGINKKERGHKRNEDDGKGRVLVQSEIDEHPCVYGPAHMRHEE